MYKFNHRKKVCLSTVLNLSLKKIKIMTVYKCKCLTKKHHNLTKHIKLESCQSTYRPDNILGTYCIRLQFPFTGKSVISFR